MSAPAAAAALRPVPEWTRGVCDPSRPAIARPYATTFRGAPALCATQGHVIVVLPGAFDAPASDFGAKARAAVAALAATPGRRLSLAALRAFCEVTYAGDAVPCDACQTRRTVPCATCDGDGFRVCDLGHEHDCDDCDGGGRVRCAACGIAPQGPTASGSGLPRGVIGGTPFDRALLARFLPYLAGATATWHAPNGDREQAHVLASADAPEPWVLAVMPLRVYDDTAAGAFKWPEFDGWTAGAAA